MRLDALWAGEGLVIELDGRATHARHAAFEAGRHRDAQLVLAGLRPVRLTWRDVTARKQETARLLGALLAR